MLKKFLEINIDDIINQSNIIHVAKYYINYLNLDDIDDDYFLFIENFLLNSFEIYLNNIFQSQGVKINFDVKYNEQSKARINLINQEIVIYYKTIFFDILDKYKIENEDINFILNDLIKHLIYEILYCLIHELVHNYQ